MTKPLLQGKVALVTGAGKGIGAAIAKMLAEEGVKLMLNARTEADLNRLKADIQDSINPHAPVEVFAGSVAEFPTVSRMVQKTVETYGRIDILINNAAIGPAFKLLQELETSDLDAAIDINLKGPLYTMKTVLPHMVHQGEGCIVNINSVAGKFAYPYSAVYCASKFGLHGLTECVAAEQRHNNIRVIGIYPGEVHTKMWDSLEPSVPQDPEKMLAVQDIAEAVRYALKQPGNAYIKDVTLVPLHAIQH